MFLLQTDDGPQVFGGNARLANALLLHQPRLLLFDVGPQLEQRLGVFQQTSAVLGRLLQPAPRSEPGFLVSPTRSTNFVVGHVVLVVVAVEVVDFVLQDGPLALDGAAAALEDLLRLPVEPLDRVAQGGDLRLEDVVLLRQILGGQQGPADGFGAEVFLQRDKKETTHQTTSGASKAPPRPTSYWI